MTAPLTRKELLTGALVGRTILVTRDRGNTPAGARAVPEGLYPAQNPSVTLPATILRYVEWTRGDSVTVDLKTTEGTISDLPARLPVIVGRAPGH
jgi:hypothetical protein